MARRGERVVGIWPLFYERDGWGLVTYRMAGHQAIVGVQPLVAHGDAEARDALVGGLQRLRPTPDRIELECVAGSFGWLERAGELRPAWRSRVTSVTSRAPYFDLADGAYERWVDERHRTSLKQTERFERRLGDHGYVRRRFTDVPSIVERIPALRSLYLGRKEARGGWGADFDDAMSAMLTSVVESLAPRGRAALSTVENEARHVIAIDLALSAGGTTSVWMGAVGTTLTQYSPGQVNITGLLADSSSAPECDRFSLGPGEEPYKSRYSNGALEVRATVLERRSLLPLHTPAALVPRRARAAAFRVAAGLWRRRPRLPGRGAASR